MLWEEGRGNLGFLNYRYIISRGGGRLEVNYSIAHDFRCFFVFAFVVSVLLAVLNGFATRYAKYANILSDAEGGGAFAQFSVHKRHPPCILETFSF